VRCIVSLSDVLLALFNLLLLCIGYVKLIDNIDDNFDRDENGRSSVTEDVFKRVLEIMKSLVSLPRIEGDGAIKAPHDKYAARLRDLLDTLCLEMALCARLFIEHRERESDYHPLQLFPRTMLTILM
jgi:hypothetical protein